MVTHNRLKMCGYDALSPSSKSIKSYIAEGNENLSGQTFVF